MGNQPQDVRFAPPVRSGGVWVLEGVGLPDGEDVGFDADPSGIDAIGDVRGER